MFGALTVIATILTHGECTPLTMPWHQLRRRHLITLRAWLIEQHHRAAHDGGCQRDAARGLAHGAIEHGLVQPGD